MLVRTFASQVPVAGLVDRTKMDFRTPTSVDIVQQSAVSNDIFNELLGTGYGRRDLTNDVPLRGSHVLAMRLPWPETK